MKRGHKNSLNVLGHLGYGSWCDSNNSFQFSWLGAPRQAFPISCFSIRTQRSWHFMKGTEVEALSSKKQQAAAGASVLGGWGISGKMTEAYKLSPLKVLIA